MNQRDIVQWIMRKTIKENSICVDMTLGNGNDLVYIMNLAMNGKVYGFDIQRVAIQRTKEKIKPSHRIQLINDSHENIDLYIHENIDFGVYNLGYLPSGNRNITTSVHSTMFSLKVLLNKLNHDGNIVISTYPRHREGYCEDIEIKKYLTTLNQHEFDVLHFDYLNRRNSPPKVYWITKVGKV